MAEPNNGLVVGGVRLMVFESSDTSTGPIDLIVGALLAGDVGRKPADLRVYDAETHELLASRRFSRWRSADRARTVLAGLAGPDGTDPVDWVGELARLDDRRS